MARLQLSSWHRLQRRAARQCASKQTEPRPRLVASIGIYRPETLGFGSIGTVAVIPPCARQIREEGWPYLRLLLRPLVKRLVAVDDVDRECLQRCVPDNLEAAVNDVGHVRQQCAGRKHNRILARLLHHGALNDVTLLDPRMGMTIQPIARLELV